MKAKLTRIKSTHNNLRTDEVIGETDDLPIVGESFSMSGEGIEFGTRLIFTTPVKNLEKIGEKIYIFSTKNSEYKLEFLE